MGAVELIESTFDQYLRNATAPVMVDFWAPWCKPCSVVSPILEEIAEQHKGEVLLAKVNVEDWPGLASRFTVESIPTLIVFRDSQIVTSIVSAMPKRYIETELSITLGWIPKLGTDSGVLHKLD